jgi:mRNA interferase MazF
MIKNKIVLLPFPFDDLSSLKVRPAVCLTEKIGSHGHIIVAFITSKIPSDLLDTDIVIDSNHPEFSRSGLKVASTVRLHRLMTVNISLIRRELGIFPSSLYEDFKTKLGKLFSLEVR